MVTVTVVTAVGVVEAVCGVGVLAAVKRGVITLSVSVSLPGDPVFGHAGS